MDEFEPFYKKHLSLIRAVALSQLRDAARAEDLTQEVFLRAWRHFGRLSEATDSAGRAWLLRTLRNLSIDAWRRSRLESSAPMEERRPATPEPELQWALLQALSELEPDDREIVVLRYMQGMNSREIGESMGMAEGTVRRRLAGCRRRLAHGLEPWALEGRET